MRRSFCAFGAGLVLVTAASAQALTTTFISSPAFDSALPGPPSVLDFDSLAAGTLLPSGSTQDGVTFTYTIDGLTLGHKQYKLPFRYVR